MNTGPIIPAIRAEVLAAKLAAIYNYEHLDVLEQLQNEPRLAELLWFIQWQSMQAGGLNKFASDFLSQFEDRVGTSIMHKIGSPKSGRYSVKDLREIALKLPSLHRSRLMGGHDWRVEAGFEETDRDGAAVVQELTSTVLHERCKQIAAGDLTRHLAALCNEVSANIGGRWYFNDLIGALLEAMDEHAARVKSGLAETTVSEQIFDGLEYAQSEKGLVTIEGESRFGKTAAIETWCGMRPGIARLVRVPDSNSEVELYKAVARALGVDFGQSATAAQLREKIDFVLHNAKLMLVLDEAHWLFPQRFSKTTPPARLNWLRSAIVDKRLPIALSFTPQSYGHARNQYLKATAHALQQFEGRFLMRVALPETLTKRDLLNVAQHHFPEFDSELLELIVAKAQQSQGYLQTIQALSQRARYIARRDNHDHVTLADLEKAISNVLPVAVPVPSTPVPAAPVRAQRRAKVPASKVISLSPAELSPVAPRGASVNLNRGMMDQCEEIEA